MPPLSLMSDIIGYILYICLLIVYLPLFALGFLGVLINVMTMKLKRWLGYGLCHSELGIVSRKSRVTDVIHVSTDEEIDFLSNRSMCYVKKMTLGTPWELVKAFLRRQNIELISDEHLVYVILSTVFAHTVVWDAKRQMYKLNMDAFGHFILFQGFYWDARQILFTPDASKIIIMMDNGDEYSSDCNPEDRPDYNLAKLHAQVCLSCFAPGLSHNHVHFVFPSAVCISSKTKLNHDSILYKLLAPHFRFTERINYQALMVGRATDNRHTFLDRVFYFWHPFPVTREQFIEGVAQQCKKYYIDKGSKACSHASSASNGHYPSSSSFVEAHHEERKHYLFPPDYITDKDLQKIPYLAFLRQYYFVVKQFVKLMEPFIEKDQWEILKTEVSRHVPRFDEVDMVDAIATFIHQVGIVHFCDHRSYTYYFAYKYGSMTIQTPFESFSNEKHWNETSREWKIKLEKIKLDPISLITQEDVLRTRCFLNLFVSYIPNSDCDMRLVSTDYKFEHAGAENAAKKFISDLRKLDDSLKSQKHLLNIPQKENDLKANGMQLLPLEDIIRSVCF